MTPQTHLLVFFWSRRRSTADAVDKDTWVLCHVYFTFWLNGNAAM